MVSLARLPLFIHLGAIFAGAMLLPMVHALVIGDLALAAIFLEGAGGLGLLVVLVGLAVRPSPPQRAPGEVLLTILGAMTLLPLALAWPLAVALPDTGLFNAWWEMVSCLTVTGASLYDPRQLAEPLHLWRGLVGWLGGLLVLVSAVSLMAPLGIGGFELTSSPPSRRTRGALRPPGTPPSEAGPGPTSGRRIARALADVTPVYAGLTAALWLALMAAGDPSLVAWMRAMGTISTSGITSVANPGEASGVPGEMLLLLFLLPALSRRLWPGGDSLRVTPRWRDDPELRLAAALVLLVTLVVLGRQTVLGIEAPAGAEARSLGGFLAAAWGGFFGALSFLTTTGWTSIAWERTRDWSGLGAPGLLLAGLAIMGGGVATAAGGVKLLRVHALAQHTRREMQRIVHPASVAGGGAVTRRLRGEGARLAFLVFMLFAVSVAVVILALSLGRVAFETATLLAVSALTNTGPLAHTMPVATTLEGTAGTAGAPWQGWAGLSVWGKSVLAAAMAIGRLETLAILALLSPTFWRR